MLVSFFWFCKETNVSFLVLEDEAEKERSTSIQQRQRFVPSSRCGTPAVSLGDKALRLRPLPAESAQPNAVTKASIISRKQAFAATAMDEGRVKETCREDHSCRALALTPVSHNQSKTERDTPAKRETHTSTSPKTLPRPLRPPQHGSTSCGHFTVRATQTNKGNRRSETPTTRSFCLPRRVPYRLR